MKYYRYTILEQRFNDGTIAGIGYDASSSNLKTLRNEVARFLAERREFNNGIGLKEGVANKDGFFSFIVSLSISPVPLTDALHHADSFEVHWNQLVNADALAFVADELDNKLNDDCHSLLTYLSGSYSKNLKLFKQEHDVLKELADFQTKVLKDYKGRSCQSVQA